MKALYIDGKLDLVEREVPLPEPGEGEVLVKVEAAPINPADLLMIQGLYPGVSEFPSRLGIEGIGRVARIGNGVDGLKFGDRVISLARTNWAERVSLSAAQVVPVPKTVDALQLAMLKANPATAHLMLRDYVSIGAGDWIIQNADNSAVSRHVIRLARVVDAFSVNVVRRNSLIAPLTEYGATAVGGDATARLADLLAYGGTAVNYGFLSGEPCHVTPDQLILRGLTLKGFWLAPKFGTMKPVEIRSHYDHLVQLFADGTLVCTGRGNLHHRPGPRRSLTCHARRPRRQDPNHGKEADRLRT